MTTRYVTIDKIVSSTAAPPDALYIGAEGQTNILRLESADLSRPDVTFATTSIPNSDQGEPNQVMTLGHNRAGSGGRQDGTRHSWHMALEREFYTGANRQAEYYVQYTSADGNTVHRPFAANVDTTTHGVFLGLTGTQNWANSSGVSTANYTENGQLNLFGSSARLKLDPGNTGELPASGTLAMVGDGQITIRALLGGGGFSDVVVVHTTTTPNLLFGSLSNPGSLYLDTANSIVCRVGGGSQSVTLSSTTTTFTMPVRLPSYTVAQLPAANPATMAYVSDGDTGSPCLAVHDGTSWKRISLGTTVSAT